METRIIEFHNTRMTRLTVNGRRCFTAEAIGQALKYREPRISIITLMNRHAEEFEKGVDYGVINLITPGGLQETTVFFQTGVNLLGMFSDRPLAVEFRRWAKAVLADVQDSQREISESNVSIPAIEYIDLLKTKIKLLESKEIKYTRKTPRRVTDQEISRMKELRAEGRSFNQIGHIIGRDRGVVSRFLRGIPAGASQ